MAEVRSFTARPLSKQARSDLKDAFRVYLSSTSLAALRLRADDLCVLTTAEGTPKTAIAWTAVENIQTTVVQTSRALQDCYGIKIGEKVGIAKLEGSLEDIDTLTLVDCSDPEKIARYGEIPAADRCHWEWALEFQLLRSEVLAEGLVFEMDLKGQRRSFQTVGIHTQTQGSGRTIARFTSATKVSIGVETENAVEAHAEISIQSNGLGGLSRQVADINECLSDLEIDSQNLVMPSFYEHGRGILIYGPKGTGKTALLEQIEKAGWRQVFKVGTASLGRSVGESESKLRTIFQEAARAKPSVILIDQLDFIAPRRTSFETPSLATVLCENLDATRNSSILVVGATRHPNNVDDALRTPHRLGTEIEIQVPTAQDRAEILRAICGPLTAGLTNELIDHIAEKTHGYVGADLFALLQLICRKSRQRQTLENLPAGRSVEQPQAGSDLNDISDALRVDLVIRQPDISSALQEIRPTAMREVFLETPKVRWSDIGGQHEIKKRLQQAVERPLKVSQMYRIYWDTSSKSSIAVSSTYATTQREK